MSKEIFEKSCRRCGKCERHCGFLSENGPPGSIVGGPDAVGKAFSCMVCGLCTELCPEGLDPASLFLHLREKAAERPARLSGLARHETVSTSFPLVLYALPDNCDTVFFPGCGLAGTRPETSEACFLALKKCLPDIGIVLDCCIRPSQDMGRTDVFGRRFTTLSQRFAKRGIRRVFTACPGCQATLSMNPDLSVSTVYEFFAEHGGPSTKKVTGEICVHDPCVTRNSNGLHEAVRLLIGGMGADLSELKNFREKPVFHYYASMGIYVMNPDVLKYIPHNSYFGFDDLMRSVLCNGLRVKTFIHEGIWYDIGTPEDYNIAAAEFTANRDRLLPAATNGDRSSASPKVAFISRRSVP